MRLDCLRGGSFAPSIACNNKCEAGGGPGRVWLCNILRTRVGGGGGGGGGRVPGWLHTTYVYCEGPRESTLECPPIAPLF